MYIKLHDKNKTNGNRWGNRSPLLHVGCVCVGKHAVQLYKHMYISSYDYFLCLFSFFSIYVLFVSDSLSSNKGTHNVHVNILILSTASLDLRTQNIKLKNCSMYRFKPHTIHPYLHKCALISVAWTVPWFRWNHHLVFCLWDAMKRERTKRTWTDKYCLLCYCTVLFFFLKAG